MAQEGLLVQEPYRGLRVADLEAATVLNIADVRVALDMQAVSAVLADSTGCRRRRLMGRVGEHTFLMRMWPVNEAHITIASAHDQVTRHDPQRAHAVHPALIDAVQTRDMDRIRAAFVAHTVDSARELVAIMTGGVERASS